MNDMSPVIIPKSDQLNSDDLISGPMNITITDVIIRPGTEQPVAIRFEGDNDKPYKACKSMCRVLVQAWGPDAKAYVGRSLTLYRDPKVKWGGLEVGGIRISHMSNITGKMQMALTETRGKRTPFVVMPLQDAPQQRRQKQPDPPPADEWSDAPAGDADPVREIELATANATDRASWEAADRLHKALEGDIDSATWQRLAADLEAKKAALLAKQK